MIPGHVPNRTKTTVISKVVFKEVKSFVRWKSPCTEQRTLTVEVSMTVLLIFSLTGLDSTIQENMLFCVYAIKELKPNQ